jgi:hypothetical protein
VVVGTAPEVEEVRVWVLVVEVEVTVLEVEEVRVYVPVVGES